MKMAKKGDSKNDEICIRKVTASDARAIKNILKITPEFNKGDYLTCMECLDAYYDGLPNYAFICAEEAGHIIGFICFDKCEIAKDVYEVYWIVVTEESRRKGVAKILHDSFLDFVRRKHARAVFIETESCQAYASAQRFYEKCGYKEVARVKDFYDIGNDKVIYGLHIA